MTAKQLEQYFRDIIRDRGNKALYSIQVFLTHSKPNYRKSAIRSLTHFPWNSVESLLIQSLDDPAIAVKKETIATFAHYEEGRKYLADHSHILSPALQTYLKAKIAVAQNKPDGVLQVSEFVNAVNDLIGETVYEVEGEISAYQTSTFGANQWVFFDLKDTAKQAKIRCFSTLFQIRRSRISPVDGMKVVVKGKARVSAKSGIFSINVEEMVLSGEGELARALELLRQKLATEGLFEQSRKRSLPYLPQTIGLITSQDAAAYQDFMKVLSHRMGGLNIVFQHAQVQGEKAVESIVNAIKLLNQDPSIEVIVVTRGGGAMDDLHAFNDESVVRAVFSSLKPVLAAVGHERDITLIDLVSDVRASTPSNAAELLVPHRSDLLNEVNSRIVAIEGRIIQDLQQYRNTITTAEQTMRWYYESIRQRFEKTTFSLVQKGSDLIHQIRMVDEKVSAQQHVYQKSISSYIDHNKTQVQYLERVLSGYNPMTILNQGYSLTKIRGKIITSIQEVQDGDMLETQMQDGAIQSIVYRGKKSS